MSDRTTAMGRIKREWHTARGFYRINRHTYELPPFGAALDAARCWWRCRNA